MKCFVYGAILCAAFRLCASPAVMSPPILNTNNQHTYILLPSATWAKSEAQAVALGGHLATIRNQAEGDWVFRTFGSYDGQPRLLWIGLSDREKKLHFSWTSGESVAYTGWAPGEPNNVGSGEDFVAIFYPGHDQAGKWNDWDDRATDPIGLPLNGVVELIPREVAANTNAICHTLANVEIRPALTITNLDCDVQLSWPGSAGGYVLESTTNLSQPFSMFGYSEVTNASSGTVSVTLTNPGPRMFFRLHKP